MAKKAYDIPIDYRNEVSWSGDKTTEDLPLAGSVVEKYIKDNFKHKAGYFYSDGTQGKCFVFANEDAYNRWAASGGKDESEILGSFGITENYRANINVDGFSSNKSAASGSKGNTIDFNWSIVDTRGAGSDTGEDATCNLVFTNGTTVRKTSFPVSADRKTVSYNVDNYLLDGTNRIQVTITGTTHKVSAMLTITYTIVNLSLLDNFNIGQKFTFDDTINILYTLKGVGTTTTEWWWDGIKLNADPEDTYRITQGQVDRSKRLELKTLHNLAPDGSGLSVAKGIHTLQYRTSVESDGIVFYTDTLYREIIIDDGTIDKPVFTTKTIISKTDFDVTKTKEPLIIKGLSQYVPYSLEIATYYPGDAASITTIIEIAGNRYSQELPKSTVTAINIIPAINGSSNIKIYSEGSDIREIPVIIEKNSLNLEELGESAGLEFNFTADGRNNSSTNKDQWTDANGVNVKFENFEWTETSGWNNSNLLMNSGDKITIENYFPFATDPGETGKTIEFEFSTLKVTDDNAVLLNTVDASGSGIKITASEASLSTIAQKVSIKYKSEERVRISFVIEKRGSQQNTLIMVYMNGILSGAVAWESHDKLINTTPMVFEALESAGIALKQIRAYNTALTGDQILNNYILYRDTFDEMQQAFSRNDIYKDGQISYEALAQYIPVLIVTGDIPHVDEQGASQKSDITIMEKVQYIDYIHNRSFVFYNAGMSCQGTSSMTYPKKNYRLYTEEKKLSKPTWPNGVVWNFDPNHSGFWRMDSSDIKNEANWKEIPWSGKKAGKHKIKYSFRDWGDYENGEPQAVSRWCIKADFAESSSTHNTNIARLWNNVMYRAANGTEHPLRTHAQEIAAKNGNKNDIRTCVDGFPIVMFYQLNEGSELHFMGKYNFNNDKATESVFGFCDIEGFDEEEIDSSALDDALDMQNYIDVKNLDEQGYKHIIYFDHEETKPDLDKGESLTQHPDTGQTGVWKNKKINQYGEAMQCWELTDSANPIALFIEKEGYDVDTINVINTGFESRYPDDHLDATDRTNNKWSNDYIDDEENQRWHTFVKPFYKWMVDIRKECTISYDDEGNITSWVNPERFSKEKYKWMDVDKMAAYYIYLIRFGAVDQVVKNAMFTTEDGQHWYYINYDNDTILGLNNYGDLTFGPFITRESKVGTEFCYAARNSTLWNCLEADKEFMEEIVPKVDDWLVGAGLTYSNILKAFEDDSSSLWCERVYNKDAEYKYISPYRSGINYLGSMQGNRKTHRRWWLSKRFDFYDGKFFNRTYKSKQFIINFLEPPSPYNRFNVTAGSHGYYATFEDETYKNRQEMQEGQTSTFIVQDRVQRGRNIIVLNAHNLYEVDLTTPAEYLAKVDLTDGYDPIVGSKMRRLILGNSTSKNNINLTNDNFKGLSSLKYLEYLSIQNYKSLTSIGGLNELKYFKELNASNSSLATVSFAKGAPVEKLTLPATLQTIELRELPLLTSNNIKFDSGGYQSVTSLVIDNCAKLKDSWNWVNQFNNLKNINLEIEWGKTSPIKWNDLKAFLSNKEGRLFGTIYLSKDELPEDIIEQLYNDTKWFGADCLNENNSIYVKLPNGVYPKLSRNYIIEDMSTEEGYSMLSLYYIGVTPGDVSVVAMNEWKQHINIVKVNDEWKISAKKSFNIDETVRIGIIGDYGSTFISLLVKNKVFPNSNNTTIIGENLLYAEGNNGYTFDLKYDDTVKGEPKSITWSVSGNGSQFVNITNGDQKQCFITIDHSINSLYTVNVNCYIENEFPEDGNDTLTKLITISLEEGIIISEASNPMLWEAIKNGFMGSSIAQEISSGTKLYITKIDAGSVDTLNYDKLWWTITETSKDGKEVEKILGVENFDEFRYFTAAKTDSELFRNNPVLKSIVLPGGWVEIPKFSFSGCTSLEQVEINSGSNEGIIIGIEAFNRCNNLRKINFWERIKEIHMSAFYQCNSLKNLIFSNNLTQIGHRAFKECENLVTVELPDSVTYIGEEVFARCSKLISCRLPNNPALTELEYGTFYFCFSLKSIEIPDYIEIIGNSCFANTGLETVNLKNVKQIKRNAFFSTELSEVTIPDNVEVIEPVAFNSCNHLTKFYGHSDFNPNTNEEFSNYLIYKDPVTYNELIPEMTTYKILCVAGGISEFTFPNNIEIIGEYAFWGCNSLVELKVPSSIKVLENNAFYACNKLESISLPQTIVSLPQYVVGFCYNLQHFWKRTSTDINEAWVENNLGDLEYISNSAFYFCTELPEIRMHDVGRIEDLAFYNCTKLAEIEVSSDTIIPTIDSRSIKVWGDIENSSADYSTVVGSKVPEEQKVFRAKASAKWDQLASGNIWRLLWDNLGYTLTLE